MCYKQSSVSYKYSEIFSYNNTFFVTLERTSVKNLLPLLPQIIIFESLDPQEKFAEETIYY